MGRLKHDQGQFFYSFRLDEAVPGDHLVRQIANVLDLSWVHLELAPFYPNVGRPSADPELMIRMLIVGYVFAIRSEPVAELLGNFPAHFCHCRPLIRINLEDNPMQSRSYILAAASAWAIKRNCVPACVPWSTTWFCDK